MMLHLLVVLWAGVLIRPCLTLCPSLRSLIPVADTGASPVCALGQGLCSGKRCSCDVQCDGQKGRAMLAWGEAEEDRCLLES